ncbi:MAG TPA: hypothetical protein VH309_11295 [Elusimicrobiota bacterium]|nr:hypothetical protein [Elusimicrobiota bacterium]
MSNSTLRERLDRLPPLPRRAARALIGPALDLPDDAKVGPLILGTLKQAYLFAPFHALLFAALGGVLIRWVPISAACEAQTAGLARLTLFALYEILGVPLLTLAAGFASRGRFRDPYAAHAARVALVLMTATFAAIACSAAASFRRQDPRLRRFGAEVLRCAYDGTPPSSPR